MRRESGDPPPLLFLGAGCSKSAGLPDEAELLEAVSKDFFPTSPVNSLSELADRLGDRTLRQFIDKIFSQPSDASSYNMLAHLVSQGFFNTIFTTNWDFLLETSLGRILSPRDFRVLVRGEVSDENIARCLARTEPRVKIIKLHGDTFSAPAIKPEELMTLKEGSDLAESLSRLASENGLIIAGYSLKEPHFLRIIRRPVEDIYYVDPQPHDEHDATRRSIGILPKNHVTGPDGIFDNFIQGLSAELLGAEYRRWFTRKSDRKDRNGIIIRRKEQVTSIHETIRERTEHKIRTEDQVNEMVKELLFSIRNTFKRHLGAGKSGACLIFINDRSAPGGTEIRRAIETDSNLKHIAREMEFDEVEVTNRFADRGPRRVINPPASIDRLHDFGAVIIVDSVAFTGNTLEIVREDLAKKSKRSADKFSVALLVVSQELEAKLKNTWWKLITTESYDGYEITFPWGWTTATRAVSPIPGQESDDFNPEDRFGYTPKPWGNQLTYCDNQRVSVRMLLLDPGQRTSLHYHLLRTETFIVLQNELGMMLWNRYIRLRKHDSIKIPPGVPHCTIAFDQPCHILEISEGYYDQGRDIVRLSDIYSRSRLDDGSDDGWK
jgi:mannose-1-phosphate guanylyltransferase/mannose-6-phosphate isomerase